MHSKENTKTKRQHTEWEKIFANDVTDKGLIKNIKTVHMTQYKKNQTTQSKKWAENLNRHFSRGDIQWLTGT